MIRPAILAALAALALAACTPENKSGYVEVRFSPAQALAPFAIMLDRQLVKPARGDSAVIKRSVGDALLELERRKDERVKLCDLKVRENRVTTVTVQFQSGVLRCYIEQA